MATSAATLIQRCRRFLGDWPENDATTASLSSSTTTLTVTDSSIYTPNWIVQVGTEGMQVRATPSGTTVTVFRGARGTTAASHASGDSVLVNPRYLDQEYLDALNAGINACYPMLYQPVIDESLTASDSVYEYTIPSVNGAPILHLSKLQFKATGDLSFREFKSWSTLTGTTPKIKLRRPLPPGVLRVYGFSPLPPLASLTDSLNTLFPVYAEDALTLFAAQYLLASGEATRVRQDTGIRDDRESANRLGGSMAASTGIYQRFLARISQSAMPPMPKHVVNVL